MVDGKKNGDVLENESFTTEGAMWDSKQKEGYESEFRLQNILRHFLLRNLFMRNFCFGTSL